MSDEIKDAIESNATGPKRASDGAGSVEQHSIQDQIAADKHLASKEALKKKTLGLRFSKLVPPGTQ